MNTSDAVRQKILAALAVRPDLDKKKLSIKIGRGESYMRDFINGSPRELNEHDRAKISEILDIPEQELMVVPVARNSALRASSAPLQSPRRQPVITEQRDLPILGHAKGGEGGHFFANGEIAGYTMRPGILIGVDDAYAVEMWDHSMAPAIKHGQLCWVHPRKIIHPDDDVVVEMKDGEALIKNLVRKSPKEVVLQQYNPPKQFTVKMSDVKGLHLVVGALRIRT